MKTILSGVRHSYEKNWPELHAAATGSLPQFILARLPQDLGSSVPVFCYHVVDAEEFESDLDFLARNSYVTIDADSLLDHLEQRCPAPEHAVVLTIDDGARNLWEVAFPLLRRYHMTAVAFVVPRLHHEECADTSAKGNADRPLYWPELREMHESGHIDFQSHTYEHRNVPRWPDPVRLTGWCPELVSSLLGPGLTMAEDFRLSKEVLEEKLHKTVRHLAFPKYNGTTEALRIGEDCGYRAFWWGVLPRQRDNRPGGSPSYIVRLDGGFLQRLPGDRRVPLARIVSRRYKAIASRVRLRCTSLLR